MGKSEHATSSTVGVGKSVEVSPISRVQGAVK